MAGPGGVEVGRASIRVLPDTSQFGKSLGAYIQRIERSLKVEIPTEIDKTGFRKDMAGIQAEAAKSQVAVPVKPVQLDDFAKRIKAEAAKLARQIEVGIPATIDGEKFRRDATAKIEGLSKLLDVEVPMDLENATAFRRQVLDQLAEVEALAKVTHPKVELKVDVDRSILGRLRSGFSAVEGAAGKASDAVGGIGQSVLDLAGNFASNLNPRAAAFAAALALGAPLAADMVATLGPGLLVAVPALAAAGAAIGVIALGSKQLGEAFKPITSRVDALKTSVGDLLTAGVRPLVAEFVDKAMPTIQTGLGRIATTMNGFLKDFLSWAGSAPTVKLIGDVFAGLNSAMKPLGGAAKAVADAVLRIAKDAAPGLGIVTGTIHDLAVQFGNFIKGKDKDGSLTKTISDSIQSAGHLIGALVNLGKAVGGLFRDIGKGSTSSFTDGINSIATAVQKFVDNGGGKQVHDFLTQVGQAVITYFTSGDFQRTVDSVKTFAANAAELTADLLDLINGAKGVKQWFDNLTGSNLGGAFDGAINPVGQLIGLFNSLMDLVRGMGPMWDTIKASTAEAWSTVSSTVSGWWDTIKTTISTKAGEAWATVTGWWDQVTATTSTAWASVTAAISTAWENIKGAVSRGISAVATFVQGLPGRVTGFFSSAWSQAKTLTASGWSGISSAVSTGIGKAVDFVKGLPGKITGALSGLFNILFNVGYNAMQGLLAGLRSLGDTVVGWATGIADKIRGAFARAMDSHSPSREMQKLGEFVVQGLILGLTGSSAQVTAASTKLADLVKSAVDSYLSQKSSLAAAIAKDAAAVAAARKRYADVVKSHGITAANAITAARNVVANANRKLAADKSHKTTAAVIRKDADTLAQAQKHLQGVIKAQGQSTAVAVGNARTALQKAIAKLAGDKADLKGLNKQFGALSDPKVIAKVQAVTDRYQSLLESIADQREQVATRLKDAQSALADVMKIRDDYAASVKQAAISFASLTSAEGKYASAKGIIGNLRARLAALNTFRTNLASLKAQGLSDDAMKQLVDAGVQAGGATAAALVKGGQTAVSEVNNLTAQISAAAGDLGTTSAAQFYQAGVDQAQALVTGLQAQSAALESQATAVAQQMVDAIKRVFAGTTYDYGFHEVGGKIPLAAKKTGTPPVVVNVTNPVPETASESTTRIMRRIATFGPLPVKTA